MQAQNDTSINTSTKLFKIIPSLPSQYLHYNSPYKLLYSTKSLFKQLLIQWKTCLMCIFKIYCIEYPKIYSDTEFLALLLRKIFIQGSDLTPEQQKLKQQQFFKHYNYTQKIYNCDSCWLCEELIQKKYLNALVQQILEMIQTNNYGNYQKYKLNIKIPLIYTLKYYLTCMYLWHQYNYATTELQCKDSNYFVDKQQLALIEQVLKTPYDKLGPKCLNNPILQTKVVSKWLISNQINTQTPMQSTIEELQDMLTLNIEHQYHNFIVQDNIMKLFNKMVGLQRKLKNKNQKMMEKPQKKVKIDLTQHNGEQQQPEQPNNNQFMSRKDKNQSFKCIANNVNKILYLKYEEIKHLFNFKSDQDFFNTFKQLQHPEILQQNQKVIFVNSFKSVSRSVKIETKNLCFSGRYCKYSRYLSQTPWVVNGIKLTESSLQEEIEDKILHLFYPKIPKDKIETKFHAGGRQDIDVRMLKGGRPFVIEMVNPILRLKDLDFQKIIEDSNLSEQLKKNIRSELANIPHPNQKITYTLQQIVNNSTQLVQVKDFQLADQHYISVQLKKAQIQKIKHYVCYIVCEQGQLTEKDRQIIDAQQDLQLDQQTPLRVLHRRTLMTRKKMVHKMYMHLVTKYTAVVQIWASAGTYIKEFIHGDLQRTLPNFGSLIGKKVDILQLDVGSLKEGNWEKGDDLKMKMDNFDWKN